jgi:hypothetical protein
LQQLTVRRLSFRFLCNAEARETETGSLIDMAWPGFALQRDADVCSPCKAIHNELRCIMLSEVSSISLPVATEANERERELGSRITRLVTVAVARVATFLP